ncbi:hypothetical protein B566_EDAN012977 [Ephemera danica]|nr:hypothetical protein B566_EDAN012977 [Ephemera danica]
MFQMSVSSEVAGLEREEGEEAAKQRRQAEELVARTIRVLRLGLGRLWRRQSVTITEYDPSFKVAYLGNVLTGWAKVAYLGEVLIG